MKDVYFDRPRRYWAFIKTIAENPKLAAPDRNPRKISQPAYDIR